MPPTIDFLTLQDVLQIHNDQLMRYGGQDGIRDEKALLSAIAQPQVSYEGEYLHHSLFDMGAAYAYHIAQNQPFIDGNKRTGLAACLSFLELNGYEVLDPQSKLADAIVAFSRGKPGEKKTRFAALIKSLSSEVTP